MARGPGLPAGAATGSVDHIAFQLLCAQLSEAELRQPTRPLPAHRLRAVSRWASTERITGLISEGLKVEPGLVPDGEASLHQAGLDATRTSVKVEAGARLVVESLTLSGIEHRVLKGLATGPLLYTESGLRDVGDVDVLLRAEDFGAAARALRPMATRAIPHYGPAHAELDKSLTLVTHDGVEVDLHRAVRGWLPSSTIAAETLFPDPVEVTVGGRPTLALPPPAMLVHAALHATTGGSRLSTVADIGLLLDRVDPDDATFLRLVADRPVDRMVRLGLALAARWIPVPDRWSGALAERPLRALGWVHRSGTRRRAAAFVAGPQLLRRTGEIVWPRAPWLTGARESRLGHVTRLVRLAPPPPIDPVPLRRV